MLSVSSKPPACDLQVVKLEPAQQAAATAASSTPQANGLDHGESAASAGTAVKDEVKAEPKASPSAADMAAKAAAEQVDDRKWMFASKVGVSSLGSLSKCRPCCICTLPSPERGVY